LQVPPSIARMEAVMGDLDLNPQQAGKALEIYSQVLQASNWGQSDSLKESKFGFLGMMNAEVGNAPGGALADPMTVQQHRARLNHLVDQVNSKFFMNSDPSSGLALASADQMPDPSEDLASASNGMALPETLQSLENPSLAESKIDLAKALNSRETAGSPSPGFFQTNSGGQDSQPSFGQSKQQSLEDRESSASVPKDTSSTAPGSMESLAQRFFSPQAFSAGLATGAANAAAKAGAAVGAESESDNIQQILDRAQVMIRKGGGEASMKLSPEGLGDLHLKVVILDGKVNVEMAAETREAKKLLESSLADLKSQLSAHKLSLESVKVDVANPTQFDSSAQAKMDSRQDQNREGLAKFFQQFRDEGSFQQRSQFYEMPELRSQAYRRVAPQPLGPEPVSTSARRAEGRGSSLNLVA
ncbi:MAG: flagellar hook-length control protein FliK, partial [Bdellovibrio sp.]